MRIRVGHPGPQHALWHSRSLEICGVLDRVVTCAYYKPNSFPDKLARLLPPFDRWLRRRWVDGIPEAKVVRRWRFLFPEMTARLLNRPALERSEHVHRRDMNFDCWAAREWVRDCDIWWGFQGSCLDSLAAAKQQGALAIAEFAAPHHSAFEQVFAAEREKDPAWAATIVFANTPDWVRARLDQEPFRADMCVVASGFSKRTLLDVGVAAESIYVLPLGCDLQRFRPQRRMLRPGEPFRILFAGQVRQHKGIRYLLEAFQRIKGESLELVLAGPCDDEATRLLKRYSGRIRVTGAIPQSALAKQMLSCHVLALPSLCEGFGLVIAEAMATGMPVIASTATGGPEMIREGQDGFVVEPGDVDALADRMTRLATDAKRAAEMGLEAAEQAQQFTWDSHARRLQPLLNHIQTLRDKQHILV